MPRHQPPFKADIIRRSAADEARHPDLPGAVFSDPDLYDFECRTIFRDGWISVACGVQVPAPGDLMPLMIAGHPLLVLRDKKGDLRVFHNVCRHRGAMLVPACGRAKAGRITCPYHMWGYRLDGSLATAPHYYADADNRQPGAELKAELGLKPVRMALWRDIIFVNLSGAAEPFEDFIAPLEARMTGLDAAELRPLSITPYSAQGNWKLAVENFLDGYHVPFVHGDAVGMDGALGQEVLALSDAIVGLRLADGEVTKPKPALPQFAGTPADRAPHQEWFAIFPNTLLFVTATWNQVIILRPEAVDRTAEDLIAYLVSDAALAPPYQADGEALGTALNRVNEQDMAILAGLQITRPTKTADAGHLALAWDDILLIFERQWRSRIEAALDAEEHPAS